MHGHNSKLPLAATFYLDEDFTKLFVLTQLHKNIVVSAVQQTKLLEVALLLTPALFGHAGTPPPSRVGTRAGSSSYLAVLAGDRG